MFSRADWQNPPPQGVPVKGRFLRPGLGHCVVVGTHNALRTVDGKPLTLLRSNSNNPGMFTPRGLHLYADTGGQDDDAIQCATSIPSAIAGPLTTILFIRAYDNGQRQYMNRTSGTEDSSHYWRLWTDDTLIMGYDGGNGFMYRYSTDYAVTDYSRNQCFIISTEPDDNIMSLSIDGQYPRSGSLLGQASYLGGGTYGTTVTPTLGGGGASFANYYSLRAWVLLWAVLPGIYLTQAEADALARNPWALFEPQSLAWPRHDMAGAAGGAASEDLAAMVLSYAQPVAAVLAASSSALSAMQADYSQPVSAVGAASAADLAAMNASFAQPGAAVTAGATADLEAMAAAYSQPVSAGAAASSASLSPMAASAGQTADRQAAAAAALTVMELGYAHTMDFDTGGGAVSVELSPMQAAYAMTAGYSVAMTIDLAVMAASVGQSATVGAAVQALLDQAAVSYSQSATVAAGATADLAPMALGYLMTLSVAGLPAVIDLSASGITYGQSMAVAAAVTADLAAMTIGYLMSGDVVAVQVIIADPRVLALDAGYSISVQEFGFNTKVIN